MEENVHRLKLLVPIVDDFDKARGKTIVGLGTKKTLDVTLGLLDKHLKDGKIFLPAYASEKLNENVRRHYAVLDYFSPLFPPVRLVLRERRSVGIRGDVRTVADYVQENPDVGKVVFVSSETLAVRVEEVASQIFGEYPKIMIDYSTHNEPAKLGYLTKRFLRRLARARLRLIVRRFL